jgi:hypothetical protein
MGQSLRMGQRHGLYQEHSHGNGRRLQKYMREALKAFKKFTRDGKTWYTCNVERLKQCDRLGEAKEVSLWKTHFFLASQYFDDAHAVVFSHRPGTELAEITKKMQISGLFLAISHTEIINTSVGNRFTLDEALVFASEDKAAVFSAPAH